MGKEKHLSREERLATQLRENLRRRKEQSRAVKTAENAIPPSRLWEGPRVGADDQGDT